MLATTGSSHTKKPKLSLSVSTKSLAPSRPSLSLKSPKLTTHVLPRTPISPNIGSPTARNTRLNQRGNSIAQQPSFAYANSSCRRSILKKNTVPQSPRSRRLKFSTQPTVHNITPIENTEDYYGAYKKMSKEERRWVQR